MRRDVFHAMRQGHATAILVTHDQDEALGFADEVAVMRDRRIVQAAVRMTSTKGRWMSRRRASSGRRWNWPEPWS